jgi:hypothetical protein
VIEEMGRETATRGFEKGPKAMRRRQDGDKGQSPGATRQRPRGEKQSRQRPETIGRSLGIRDRGLRLHDRDQRL